MVRNLVVKIEAAEPAIGEMQFDLLAKPPLKANAVAVANDEHADHQFGVDRWPPDLAVEGRQLLPEFRQYPTHNRIDAAKEMAFRDALLKVEEIEQLALIDRLPTHHDPPPPKASTKRNHDSPIITSDFFNSIGQNRKSRPCLGMSPSPQLADIGRTFPEVRFVPEADIRALCDARL